MSGYSGTAQARKLGLKAGQRVALDQPPDAWSLREPPDGLRAPGAELGMVDVMVAAIDDDWSGLRLVWRVSNR